MSDAFKRWEAAAYDLGFVPNDALGGYLVPWWRRVAHRPDRMRRLGLQEIRKWNHVMWRGFSWGNGGFIDEALRFGATQAMLRRLEALAHVLDIDEDATPAAMPKADTYGGLLIDGSDRILLLEPKGQFRGYAWTFAKGRPGKSEGPEQAALKKVLEKTGYQAEVFDVLPQIYEGDTTTTAYFLMAPVGEARGFSDETTQTSWVGFREAADLIARTTSAKGRERDLAVLSAAQLAIGDSITS